MATKTQNKVEVVTQAAIQKAQFANAFDAICQHYDIDIEKYQKEKFEIGYQFAYNIHPEMVKNKNFWKYWTFLWDKDNTWIAQNLDIVTDYYAAKWTMVDSEPYINNVIDYVNRYEPETK